MVLNLMGCCNIKPQVKEEKNTYPYSSSTIERSYSEQELYNYATLITMRVGCRPHNPFKALKSKLPMKEPMHLVDNVYYYTFNCQNSTMKMYFLFIEGKKRNAILGCVFKDEKFVFLDLNAVKIGKTTYDEIMELDKVTYANSFYFILPKYYPNQDWFKDTNFSKKQFILCGMDMQL